MPIVDVTGIHIQNVAVIHKHARIQAGTIQACTKQSLKVFFVC